MPLHASTMFPSRRSLILRSVSCELELGTSLSLRVAAAANLISDGVDGVERLQPRCDPRAHEARRAYLRARDIARLVSLCVVLVSLFERPGWCSEGEDDTSSRCDCTRLRQPLGE